MAVSSFDLGKYLARKGNLYDKKLYPWWDQITKLSTELEDEYVSKLPPETKAQTIYSDMGAVKVEYSSGSLSEYFWLIGLIKMRENGYKNMLGRCSSSISSKILQRLGGKVVRKVHFEK